MWLYIIIGVVLAIIAIYLIAVYNRFINLKNGIESTFKQISVALKKRLDMISQVVDSVKGQMKFEKSTLTDITKLRSHASQASNPAKAGDFDKQSSAVLSALRIQVEAYPQLKSNENVSQLISSINSLEDEISRLRYTFNNIVQEFNTKLEMFPTNMIAGMFGFKKQEYTAFEESDKTLAKAPKIKLE
jgi:LemA protein